MLIADGDIWVLKIVPPEEQQEEDDRAVSRPARPSSMSLGDNAQSEP